MGQFLEKQFRPKILEQMTLGPRERGSNGHSHFYILGWNVSFSCCSAATYSDDLAGQWMRHSRFFYSWGMAFTVDNIYIMKNEGALCFTFILVQALLNFIFFIIYFLFHNKRYTGFPSFDMEKHAEFVLYCWNMQKINFLGRFGRRKIKCADSSSQKWCRTVISKLLCFLFFYLIIYVFFLYILEVLISFMLRCGSFLELCYGLMQGSTSLSLI